MRLTFGAFLAVGFAGIVLASGEPALSQSFKCANAKAPDEIAICRSPELSRLDEQLAISYRGQLEQANPSQRPRIVAEQRAWLDARRRCGQDPQCIGTSYRTRIGALTDDSELESPPTLIGRWHERNSLCRGGRGDDPRTVEACGERERLGQSLERKGWCFGERWQAGFEMFWHDCIPAAYQSNAPRCDDAARNAETSICQDLVNLPDGTKYAGEIMRGAPHGVGGQFNADGSIARLGNWSGGSFVGADFATPSPRSAPAAVITMEKDLGTYVVPATINGSLSLKFVVDSGASDVSIPADVFLTLLRTKTVDDRDFVGDQTYVLADGSRVKSKKFRIRSLKVGNKVVENVIASISAVQGELLLGQSFLGQFRSWSIDNVKHVLILE